ncbi:MAG: hypothetical protein OEY11_13490 [Gammaproteobacteria bacterium]|nr:hypothetical protein [Gammaproteobacteria bacterium]
MIVTIVNVQAASPTEYRYTLRYGTGGFNDARSPLNKLGGDQLGLDIRIKDSALSLLLASEYYTNSPDPTHAYEISRMYSINLLYHADTLLINNASIFMGGGVGRLSVPETETNPGSYISSDLLSLEAGLYLRPYQPFGFFGLIKYLYAEKNVAGHNDIDFNELIFLIGVSYDF